jgi:hypothetical protein
VRVDGGTNLSLGIQAGFDELRSLEHASLLSRAIFLTDMESGADDEARVIQGTRSNFKTKLARENKDSHDYSCKGASKGHPQSPAGPVSAAAQSLVSPSGLIGW